ALQRSPHRRERLTLPTRRSSDLREGIAEALRAGSAGFFVLTNSRSLGPEAASDLAVELGGWIREAARSSGRAVSVISRSDSTLRDRKSTRLNSSHQIISYAVFCL